MSASTGSRLRTGALLGFADGASYDNHRPNYPPAALDLLLEQLAVANKKHARIIDLAAGTGKFTELLASRPEKFEIIAVEPHDGMRAQLNLKALPGVRSVTGYADDIPVEAAWADALICAQSFHWFSTQDALSSIARTLKPSASLGLIWNIEDYNSTLSHLSPDPWTLKLRQLLFHLDTESPPDTPALRFRNQTWRQVFQQEKCSFKPIHEQVISWAVKLSPQDLWARFQTLSQIATMSDEQLESVHEIFDSALQDPSTELDESGKVIVRGITFVAWSAKSS